MSRTTMALRLVLLGDRGHRLTAFHRVQRDAHAFIRAQQFEVLREGVGGIARQQQEVRAGRIGRPAMEAGLSSYTSSSVMPASSAASVRSSWPPVSTRAK